MLGFGFTCRPLYCLCGEVPTMINLVSLTTTIADENLSDVTLSHTMFTSEAILKLFVLSSVLFTSLTSN